MFHNNEFQPCPAYNASESLPANFRDAAAPQSAPLPPPKNLVTVALDEDVLAFLRRDSEPANFNQVVNDTLRLYMDTSLRSDADFDRYMASLPPGGPTP